MPTTNHPLHSTCSYLGGFPPRVPRRIIEKWVSARATVLDPFCGAGTTLLEAIRGGRRCVGIDLNPLAVAVSKAKVQRVELQEVLDRITDLGRDYRGNIQIEEVPPDIRLIFHDRTVAQLCYLRDALEDDRPEDVFLRGAILGIMHGKFRSGGKTSYLSIDMPNTFSMSPDYVRGFVKKHLLTKPPVDVFRQLEVRSRWLLREGSVPERPAALVLEGDAIRLPALLRHNGIRTVGAVVTSPPYLGILRYGAFNWIRLWFLGCRPETIDRKLDGTDSLDAYLTFLANFLDAAAQVLRPGAPLVLVVGDVVENNQHVRLARRVWQELGQLSPFELLRIERDNYDQSVKTTRIWGEERKGRATPVDRIMVLRRVSRRTMKSAV